MSAPAAATTGKARIDALTYARLSRRVNMDEELKQMPADRRAMVEALRLHNALCRVEVEAWTNYEHDRQKRAARLRMRNVRRIERRYAQLDRKPAMPLGNLRRSPVAAIIEARELKAAATTTSTTAATPAPHVSAATSSHQPAHRRAA